MDDSPTDVACSKTEQRCKIRASVTTGFEFLAVQEIKEKLQCEFVQQGRGFVSWQMPLSTSTEAMKLRTVDNLLVMMAHFEDMPICKDKADKENALELIENKIPTVDFETGLKVWKKFTDFQEEMSAKMASISKPSNVCVESLLADDVVTEAQTQTEILAIDAQTQTVVDQKSSEIPAKSCSPDRKESTFETKQSDEMPKETSAVDESLELKLMEENNQSAVQHMDRKIDAQNVCAETAPGDREVQNTDTMVQNPHTDAESADREVQNAEIEILDAEVEIESGNTEVQSVKTETQVKLMGKQITSAGEQCVKVEEQSSVTEEDDIASQSAVGEPVIVPADKEAEFTDVETQDHIAANKVHTADTEQVVDGMVLKTVETEIQTSQEATQSTDAEVSGVDSEVLSAIDGVHNAEVENEGKDDNIQSAHTEVIQSSEEQSSSEAISSIEEAVKSAIEPEIQTSQEITQSTDAEVSGVDSEVLSAIDGVHNAEVENEGKDNNIQSAHTEVIQSSEEQSSCEAVSSIVEAVKSTIEPNFHHTDGKEKSDVVITSLTSEPLMQSTVSHEPEQALSSVNENDNLEKLSNLDDGEKSGFCVEYSISGAPTVSDNSLANVIDVKKEDDAVKVDNAEQVCNNGSHSESKFVHSSVPKEEKTITSEKSAAEKTKDEIDQSEEQDNVIRGDEAVSADAKFSDDLEQLMAERDKIRKILCLNTDVDNKGSLSFRATCNRAGDHHAFGSPDVSRRIGGAIGERFEWQVDLKNYDVEVVILVTDKNVSFGLSLTRESLHRRNISSFGRTTLRGTLCAGLLRLADVRPGEFVLDPLCGTGGITIEGAIEYPESFHIAGDNQQFCVDCSRENLDEMNRVRKAMNQDLLKASAMLMDARHLPLPTSFVDVIVTDMPFGRKHGNKYDNRKLYPAILTEAARVCKPGSGRVVLLTTEKSLMTKVVTSMKQWWYLRRSCFVNHGGLSACTYLLKRTGKEWCDPSDPHYGITTERTAGFGARDIRQNVERRIYNASSVSKEEPTPSSPSRAVLTAEGLSKNISQQSVKVADNSIESQMEKKSTAPTLTNEMKDSVVEVVEPLEENKEVSARAVTANAQPDIQDKEPTTSEQSGNKLPEKMDADQKKLLVESSSQNSEAQERKDFNRQSYQRNDDRYGYGWRDNRRGFGGGRGTRPYRYEPMRRCDYRGDYQGRGARGWHGDGDYHPRNADKPQSSQQQTNSESQPHGAAQTTKEKSHSKKKKKPRTEEQKLRDRQRQREKRQLRFQSGGQASGRADQSAGSEGQVKSNSSLPHDSVKIPICAEESKTVSSTGDVTNSQTEKPIS